MNPANIHLRITTTDRASAVTLVKNLLANKTLKKYIKKYLIYHEISIKGQSHIHCRLELTEDYEISFKKRLSEFIKKERDEKRVMGTPGYKGETEKNKEKNESYCAKDEDLIATNYSDEELDNIKEYVRETKESMKKNTINKICEIYKKMSDEDKSKITTATHIMRLIDDVYIMEWDKEPPSVSRLRSITLAVMTKLNIIDVQFLAQRYDY